MCEHFFSALVRLSTLCFIIILVNKWERPKECFDLMKVRLARVMALAVAMMMIVSIAAEPVFAAKIKGKTGIGMAEWAFKAYNEGWTYKWGGSSAGNVDCSGLIRSYCNGKGGGAKALLDASSVNGSANDMPRIHGLGLWCDGHAGVYG